MAEMLKPWMVPAMDSFIKQVKTPANKADAKAIRNAIEATLERPILHEKDGDGNWICCCGDHLERTDREREALISIMWDTWEDHHMDATPSPVRQKQFEGIADAILAAQEENDG